jgi:hypothetical protein
VPDEHRAVMAAALLFSGEAAAVEASVGWLLDPAAPVRQAMAPWGCRAQGQGHADHAAPYDHDAELAAGGQSLRAMDFALIRSFFSTARKQGWNIIDALTRDSSHLAKSLRLA